MLDELNKARDDMETRKEWATH